MLRKSYVVLVIALFSIILLLSSAALGRTALGYDGKDSDRGFVAQEPDQCSAMHDVGELLLSVNNNGTFGTSYAKSQDCFTNEPIPAGGCEYPKGSGQQYNYGSAFWVGAIVGRDTLVSVGHDGWIGTKEFYPEPAPFGHMIRRSTIDPNDPMYENAISEQDYVAVYMDTFVNLAGTDSQDGNRKHKPINIKVTQNSYAWSYSYAEDLVLFDYKIKNIGIQELEDVYMGIYVDADIGDVGDDNKYDDDISGFLPYWKYYYGPNDMCSYEDNPFIAWIADNDGNLNEDNPALSPTPHVTATRIVRTPAKELNVSFNWWISNGNTAYDFGPRLKGTEENPFRDFRFGGLGTPERDDNKYHVLSNGEFDYNQVYTANIQPTDENWLYPSDDAEKFSKGWDTRYFLSFGPFYIQPGQTLPLSFAYVAGKDLHVDKDNYDNNLVNNYNPKLFEDNLNFDDLALNARWASWIYDNPGVDTDGDGDSGVFVTCKIDSTILDSIDVLDSTVIDSTLTPPETTLYSHDSVVYDYIEAKQWIKGDDVPDFKGASPPPAPDFWIEPTYDRLGIRFNGYRSETTEDIFSQNVDFEGYRIYMGRDERSESYSLITSYDRPDYNKYVYSKGAWTLNDVPYSLEELQNLYKTPVITDPLIYTRTNPYSYLDSLFYFDKQDLNASDLGTVGSIHKLYPDQPKPSTSNPALAKPEELTEDGYFKYYEYEYIIEDLLPYVQYWVNITAFDYGSPGKGLEALETSRTVGAQSSYALPTTQDAARDGEKVFIYPNPYRIDAGYRNLGLEGRGSNQRTLPDDRVRAVHFANLPAKCTISIFTLDGDLVKEIDHDIIPSDPNASHDTWDLITRNTQLVVSGIYYWTIEAENGETQVGKLVIIM